MILWACLWADRRPKLSSEKPAYDHQMGLTFITPHFENGRRHSAGLKHVKLQFCRENGRRSRHATRPCRVILGRQSVLRYQLEMRYRFHTERYFAFRVAHQHRLQRMIESVSNVISIFAYSFCFVPAKNQVGRLVFLGSYPRIRTDSRTCVAIATFAARNGSKRRIDPKRQILPSRAVLPEPELKGINTATRLAHAGWPLSQQPHFVNAIATEMPVTRCALVPTVTSGFASRQ